MPQSFTKLYAHLVFSTKDRIAILDDQIRPRVHAYIASMVRGLESPYVVVGGVADHVHILFDMGKLHAPVEFVEQVSASRQSSLRHLARRIESFIGSVAMGCFR
jgi:putative transposase